MNKYSLLLIAAAIMIAASCRKSGSGTSRTTCTSTLYAYTQADSLLGSSSLSCYPGAVNLSTGGISLAGLFAGQAWTLTGTIYDGQAAYNDSDFCYYVFKTVSDTLYKIASSGGVTVITGPAGYYYGSLVYNRYTHQFYCTKCGSTGQKLVSLTISGSTFTTTDLVTPVRPFFGGATIDNATGTVYYVTGDSTATDSYNIEKYTPGASASTVVATGSTGEYSIYGLRFNKTDNMLYALGTSPVSANAFIKINPSGGTITTLAYPSIYINNSKFLSAAIDVCTNQYIVTSKNVGGAETDLLYVLDMTGAVITTDTTASFYSGLTTD